jgi:hypothetical protein
VTEKTHIEDLDEQKDHTTTPPTCTPPSPSDDDDERLTPPWKSPREEVAFPTSFDDVDDLRGSLLRWRFIEASDSPPSALATLTTIRLQNEREQQNDGTGSSTPSWRQTASTPTGKTSRPVLPPSSENAYKVLSSKAAVDRETELRRCVQSNLNKICPENVSSIASKIKNEANVQSVGELKSVIALIFKKALSEPHYCETYADMVYHLKTEMPEFPSSESGKPVTFKATLLNVCQDEFESMPRTLAGDVEEEAGSLDPEEIEYRKSQRKKRFLANMKFIGHLFLRQLLVTKVIASIMQDLLNCDTEALPEEPIVECVCELISAIGYTLDESSMGNASLTQVCGRMLELKKSMREDGKKSVYSKRIQFAIQDVLDTRTAGWTKKVFKTAAKTKEEVRLDMARGGKDESGAEFVVAGQRPSYLTPIGAQASEKWQDANRLLRETGAKSAVLSRSQTAPAQQ